MHDFIKGIFDLPTPFNMVVLIVLISMSVSLLSSFVKQLRKYACHRHELEFKREMLDRGLSAEEISQIVQAKGPGVDQR